MAIVLIDIVLGGDNAIVIALASKSLPPRGRKLAMCWGIIGAVAVRAVLTAVALWLLKIPLLQFIGGVLLVWIAIKLLVEEKDVQCKTAGSLGEAIKIIIMADVVMGVDNVIAIAGAAHGNIILVVIGLLISVPIIMWGSTVILKFMEKYPVIIYIGGGILAWTAGQMMASDQIIMDKLGVFIPGLEWLMPLLTVILVLVAGYYRNMQAKVNCNFTPDKNS
ncbi:MAG: TerC family protein [Syntrophomonas sp.]